MQRRCQAGSFAMGHVEVGIVRSRIADSAVYGCATSVHARFWVLPGDPATWPHFIASLLEGLDPVGSGPPAPLGEWLTRTIAVYNEGIFWDVVLRGVGVPDGATGAVRFDRDKEDALIAVLFAYLAFGWCVDDDLFFIPDHGRQLLQTDHHDVIHAVCASEERVQKLVGQMAQAATSCPGSAGLDIQHPAWMGGGNTEDEETGAG